MLGNLLDTPGKELWATLEKFAQRGINREDWEALRANDGNNSWMDLVVEAMLASKIRTRTFKVRVNHSKAIEEKTATGFIYVNSNITSNNFPVNQTGEMEVEAVAVNFGRKVTLNKVRCSFAEMGLETGILTLLVDTSNQHQTKELDKCLPLISPDPVWVAVVGIGRVACLGGGVGGRRLDLDCAGGAWRGSYWFLGFRTSVSN